MKYGLIQRISIGFVFIGFAVNGFAQTVISLSNTAAEPFHLHIYLASNSSAPTVIALHGCGGMLNPKGAPNLRTNDYAKLLNAQGWNAVFTNSFTPRGVRSVCGGNNEVTQSQRLQDTQAAVAYVAAQPWADAKRIAILGWSHGGTAALLAANSGVAYAVPLKAAAMFYPGCTNAAYFGTRSGWKPAVPMLMQLGEIDDWTDPAPCQALAAAHGIKHVTYPNAHHDFDATEPVTQRKSVLSRKTGQGVHAGGEPAARAASQAALVQFLKQAFE